MAVTRAGNSGIRTGVLKYDSMLGGNPPVMPAPTATAGAESASVAFTAISGITTYRVISSPGSITATGSASPISVTGLTGGTAYTFQIRGENTVGNGPYSAASNSVTPTVATAYESLATVTLSSPQSTAITFSSISSAYKHLQVRAIIRCNDGAGSGPSSLISQINGDTGSNYAWHYLTGTGSTASATGAATQTRYFSGQAASSSSSANIFGAMILDIHDYASTSKTKTIRHFSGADHNSASPNGAIQVGSGLWNSTSAITSLSFVIVGGISFASGTSFALYGIKG